MIRRRSEGEFIRSGINWNFYRLPAHSPKTWVFSVIVSFDLWGKRHHFDLWIRRRHLYSRFLDWGHDSRALGEDDALA